MRSNDLTNSKKTEIQAAMQKALQNNDAEGAAAAFDQMLEYVVQNYIFLIRQYNMQG